jgi:nucleolar protein 14
MGQILGQMTVRGVQDLARGLFVCSVFLEYERLARRVVPEVVNFLTFTLGVLSGRTSTEIPNTRSEMDIAHLRLEKKEARLDVPGNLAFTALYDENPDIPRLKLQVLVMTLELFDTASTLWSSLPSLPELFHPAQELLQHLTNSPVFRLLPPTISTRTLLATLTQRLKLSRNSRSSLVLQSHRPIPIPSYLPKFSMHHSFDSRNDPDHSRAALSKLTAQHRREKKSVVRELRKEARTEAVIQNEEGRRRDRVYEERMRVAEGVMRGGNSGVGKWERDQKRKRR